MHGPEHEPGIIGSPELRSPTPDIPAPIIFPRSIRRAPHRLQRFKSHPFREERNNHKAICSPVKDTAPDGQRMLDFDLQNGEFVRVLLPYPQDKITLGNEHSTPPELTTVLGNRQIRNKPTSSTDIAHNNNLLFFHANWARIAGNLYKTFPSSIAGLKGFTEVNLSDYLLEMPDRPEHMLPTCGAIDFLGIGPDGKLIVIEFAHRAERKSKQLAKQIIALQNLIKHNTIPPHEIVAYKGEYSYEGNSSQIRLLPPSIEYFPWSPHVPVHDFYTSVAS